jgi:hypothetical protein
VSFEGFLARRHRIFRARFRDGRVLAFGVVRRLVSGQDVIHPGVYWGYARWTWLVERLQISGSANWPKRKIREHTNLEPFRQFCTLRELSFYLRPLLVPAASVEGR